MTLERLLRELTDMNIAAVAKKAGVGYNGLARVVCGETKNPGIDMVEKLQIYFENRRKYIIGE